MIFDIATETDINAPGMPSKINGNKRLLGKKPRKIKKAAPAKIIDRMMQTSLIALNGDVI